MLASARSDRATTRRSQPRRSQDANSAAPSDRTIALVALTDIRTSLERPAPMRPDAVAPVLLQPFQEGLFQLVAEHIYGQDPDALFRRQVQDLGQRAGKR